MVLVTHSYMTFVVCTLHLHLNNVLDDSLNIAEVSLNSACAVFDPFFCHAMLFFDSVALHDRERTSQN